MINNRIRKDTRSDRPFVYDPLPQLPIIDYEQPSTLRRRIQKGFLGLTEVDTDPI